MKHELTEMLASSKENPPAPRYTVEDALKAGRKRQSRRRMAFAGAGSAAAIVAVAAAIAVPQIVTTTSPNNTTNNVAPAAGGTKATTKALEYPTGSFAGNLAPFESGDLSVSGAVQVSSSYQVANIVAPGHGSRTQDSQGKIHQSANDVGNVVVYNKGVYTPTAVKGGESVLVGKKPGLFVAAKKESTDPATEKKIGAQYTDAILAWQYADDSWAVVNTHGASKVTESAMINLAQNVTSTTPVDTKVDFKLGYVPTGFALQAAGTSADGLTPLDGQSYLRVVKGTTSYTGLTAPILDAPVVGDKQLPTLSLSVYPAWFAKHTSKAGACSDGGTICYKSTKDGKFVVEVNGGGFVGGTELLKVVQSVTFADPADTSTWFKASSAVS